MLAKALREVFGRGFNICPIRASPDGHHPFQWIVSCGLVLFVVDEAQNLGFMGSPIGPMNGQKPFGIAVLDFSASRALIALGNQNLFCGFLRTSRCWFSC